MGSGGRVIGENKEGGKAKSPSVCCVAPRKGLSGPVRSPGAKTTGQLADWEVTQKWSLSGAKEWEGGPRDTAGSPRAHPTLRPSEGASPPSL